MEAIFQDIRDISIRHNILFVLVNGTSTNFGRNLDSENQQSDLYFDWMPKQHTVVPALGRYFPYCCDEIFRFEKKKSEAFINSDPETEKSTSIMFYVERSSEIKPQCFDLQIDKDGVRLAVAPTKNRGPRN